MIKAAVIGSPISHSLSPKIHTRAYEIMGLPSSYTAIEISEDTFPKFFQDMQSGSNLDNWTGISLTMPLKEMVLGYCKNADPIATAINSGNTLYRDQNEWRVTSTDYFAFKNLLTIPRDSKVAIIGGGGTARAAIGALDSKVGAVDVLLRSTSRLAGLRRAAPNLEITELKMSDPLSDYDLIIQTTPAEIYDKYVVALERAPGILLEVLYKPWPSKLAESFRELGGEVISGKELLVEQALFQIELFSGQSFDFEAMRVELLSHIASD